MDEWQRVREVAAIMLPGAVELTRRLVRCPSLPGEEGHVADILIEEMKNLGYDEVFRDDWGNVIGVIQGQESGPAILFNGHMDHVYPGDIALWEGYDPYGGDLDVVEIENRDGSAKEQAQVIHGRGAADMKGGLACAIYSGKLLLRLREEGIRLKGKYIVTAVCREEPGDQVGTIQLINDTFRKLGWHYDAAVSCEPSSLDIALGHRGRVVMIVSIHGKISHGSAPWRGINAVYKANKFIEKIANELPKKFLTDPDLGRSSIALTLIKSSPPELCFVPERCDIHLDRRYVPGETLERCVKEVQDILDDIARDDPEFRAEVKIIEEVHNFYTGKSVTMPNEKKAWKMASDHPFVQAMAAGLVAVGQKVKFKHWDFGTDLPKVVADDHKPAVGYSAAQEHLIHVPVEKLRTDYMQQSIAGYAAGFLKIMNLPKTAFHVD